MQNQIISIGNYSMDRTQVITSELENYIFKCICREPQNGKFELCHAKEIFNNSLEQVEQEIAVLRKIKDIYSKNIIEIKDIINQNNIYYIIFEEYQTTLKDRIVIRRQQNQPFETMEILDMFWQILQGYKCLQQASIIHDNITTENIIFKDGLYKIMNFSRAKLLDTNESDKMNLFNLGCVLYEMASLKHLFQAHSYVDQKLSQQVFYNNSKNNQIKINQISLPDSKDRAQLIKQLLTLTIVEHNTSARDLESMIESQFDNKIDSFAQILPDEGLNQYFTQLQEYQRYSDYDIEIFEERKNLKFQNIEDKFKLVYLSQIGYLYLQERQLTIYNSSYQKSVQSNLYYYWFLMRLLFIHVILSVANASIQLLEGHLDDKEIYLAVDKEELDQYLQKKLQCPSRESQTKNQTDSTTNSIRDQCVTYLLTPLSSFEENLHRHLKKIKESLQLQLKESFTLINKGFKPIQTKCTLTILAELGARKKLWTNKIIFFIRELYNEEKDFFKQFHYDKYIQQVMDLHNKYQTEEYSPQQLEEIILDLNQCNIIKQQIKLQN